PSVWFAFAAGDLRAKLGLSMPHASDAGIGAWPTPCGHRVPCRFQQPDSRVPIMRPQVERRLPGPSTTERYRAPRRRSGQRSDILPGLAGKLCRKARGDRGMGGVDVLRNKAEEYLEKARAISDRQRARLLLLQAHNSLKGAEEKKAQQLSARR